MKYYRNKNERNLLELVSYVEKITGVIINYNKKGQQAKAVLVTEELFIKFDEILERRKSNVESFNLLLNTQIREYGLSNKTNVNPQRRHIKYHGFIDAYLSNVYKLWQSGIHYKNYDLTYTISKELQRLLTYSSVDYQYTEIAEPIIRIFYSISHYCNINKINIIDSSIITAYYQWFFYWSEYVIKEKDFDSIKRYYKSFRSMLWRSMLIMIKFDNQELKSSFISYLFDGYRYQSAYLPSIINSGLPQEFIDEYEHETRNLHKLRDFNKLIKWHDSFKDFIEREKKFDEIQIAKIYDNTVMFVMSRFFGLRIKELVSFISSYALFQEKPEFIYELWHFRQPNDSRAIHGGNDILPETIGEIVHCLLEGDKSGGGLDFLIDGHHDILTYYYQYHALLIVRQYVLPKFLTYQNFLGIDYIPNSIPTSSISHLKDLLKSVQFYVQKYMSSGELLKQLGINVESVKDKEPNPDELVSRLMNLLTEKANQDEIEMLVDEGLISEFEKAIILIYKEQCVIRNIITNYSKQVIAPPTEENYELDSIGLFEITTKMFLVKGQGLSYSGFYENYGKEMAYQENNLLISKICAQIPSHRKLKIETFKNLEDFIIQENVTNSIVICKELFPERDIFGDSLLFKPKEIEPGETVTNLGIVGSINDNTVHYYYDNTNYKQVLILSNKNLPTITNYLPNSKNDREGRMVDNFFMSIIPFNDDELLLNKYLDEPPFWLVDSGGKDEQRKTLLNSVEIKVFEKLQISDFDTDSAWLIQLEN